MTVEDIIDTNTFSEWLGLQTNASKKTLISRLNNWNCNQNELQGLSYKYKMMKNILKINPLLFKKCNVIFEEITKIETEWKELIENPSDVEQESYNELLFCKEWVQPLNFIPYMLSIWSCIRIYILPAISLILPIITLLVPYFIIIYILKLPIKFDMYMNILQSLVTGNSLNVSDKPFFDSSISPLGIIKQLGVFIITLVQSIIQPYWTYNHLHNIDIIIQQKGILIMRFRELYDLLSSYFEPYGLILFRNPLPSFDNEREALARILIQSSYFKLALKYIGSLEILIHLANRSDIYPVKWVSSNTPVFICKDVYDYQVSEKTRKPCSIRFDKIRHALLTGPNKGGKSTVLRSFSSSALLAHTYGCSFGHITMTPFYKMCVCLKPDDLPGSKSRFEREIEFTSNTLKYNKPILVFIDELYHSTNPSDAHRSSEIYSEQLWKKQNIISVISTHIFEWVDKSENIQKICCPAYKLPDGNIHFEYYLTNGICKVSSVDILLKKNGLLCV